MWDISKDYILYLAKGRRIEKTNFPSKMPLSIIYCQSVLLQKAL
jgi:hypothetical protein